MAVAAEVEGQDVVHGMILSRRRSAENWSHRSTAAVALKTCLESCSGSTTTRRE
jgi:hypothetical protein